MSKRHIPLNRLPPAPFKRATVLELEHKDDYGRANGVVGAFLKTQPTARVVFSSRIGQFGGFTVNKREDYIKWLRWTRTVPLPDEDVIPIVFESPESPGALDKLFAELDAMAYRSAPRFLKNDGRIFGPDK